MPSSPAMPSPIRTSRRSRVASLVIFAAVPFMALAAAPSAAQAQDQANGERPSVEATRIPDGMSIRIDGRLNDEAWELARPITELRQEEPVEGGEPSEPSEIRILYDSDALYIGAILWDSNPEGILAHQLQRNAGLGTDDRFMWILDTFQDGRTGYFFETNPIGLMGDGLIGGGGFGGGVNKRWDGIWEVRTQVLPDGWSVEIRIPFSTLNFDPARDTWGINFQRTIRRRSEEMRWSGWRRNESLTRPASAGELRGLEGISQGVGMQVTPYVVTSGSQDVGAGEAWAGDAKTGVDLTYSVTPSLRAGLTVNTDFAEVEVDQRRVNLTRFPLRFPEQREFFLEGSGVFSFNWADPFFSRRIGLVQGQEVPIRYGARLAGQAGRYEMGFYQIRTGQTSLEGGQEPQLWPSEDFTVGRVRRSLFRQSHVGAIYTRRSSAFSPGEVELADRHTVGADFNLYTSQALGRYNAQFEGFMIFHTDPVVGGGGLLSPERRARGYRWNLPNDVFRLHSSYRDFGVAWDPAVGFAQRRGFRRHQPTLTLAPRPQWWSAVRQMEFSLAFTYLTDMENRLLERSFDLTFLQLNFESGDRLSLEAGTEFERLERTFTIHGSGDNSVVIEAGDYTSRSFSAGARSAGRRMVSGNADVSWSDFWDGERTRFDLGTTLRPRRGVSISTDYQRNEVRLPQGDFNTNLVRLSGSWNLSPLASVTGNVQYDDVSQVVGLFARARWIVRPGSDIYLVWTHNWRNEVARLLDREFTTLSRGGAMKVNYSYRF
jgi:hypothetical protein